MQTSKTKNFVAATVAAVSLGFLGFSAHQDAKPAPLASSVTSVSSLDIVDHSWTIDFGGVSASAQLTAPDVSGFGVTNLNGYVDAGTNVVNYSVTGIVVVSAVALTIVTIWKLYSWMKPRGR